MKAIDIQKILQAKRQH